MVWREVKSEEAGTAVPTDRYPTGESSNETASLRQVEFATLPDLIVTTPKEENRGTMTNILIHPHQTLYNRAFFSTQKAKQIR